MLFRSQRVVWRLDRGRLERGFVAWWPGSAETLRPASDVQAPGGAGVTWQPVAAGVDSIAWRAYLPGRGWLGPVQRAEDPATPVTGIEIALIRGGQRIVRVFSVRD